MSRETLILRAEIKGRNLNYEDLAEALGKLGVKDNARNLSNKIARGASTAGSFVMCLEAIGVLQFDCTKADER
jgi:hypothetical protein